MQDPGVIHKEARVHQMLTLRRGLVLQGPDPGREACPVLHLTTGLDLGRLMEEGEEGYCLIKMVSEAMELKVQVSLEPTEDLLE